MAAMKAATDNGGNPITKNPQLRTTKHAKPSITQEPTEITWCITARAYELRRRSKMATERLSR